MSFLGHVEATPLSKKDGNQRAKTFNIPSLFSDSEHNVRRNLVKLIHPSRSFCVDSTTSEEQKLQNQKYDHLAELDYEFQFFLSPPRVAFLAWGDFQARSRFARSTIPEDK